MRQFAKTVIQHPLISGSGIIILGTSFGNVFNFLFNLFMSRNLPIADYGVLASMVSLITLSTIPLSSITPAIVSFAGGYFAKGEQGMVGLFYRRTFPYLAVISSLILLFVIFYSQNIADYFRINSGEIVLYSGITVAIIYLGSLNIGLLQAKLSFKFISFSNLLSSFIKFSVGVFLVLAGYGIGGAVTAFLLSFLVPIIISYIPLISIFKETSHSKYKLPTSELISYGIPSAVAIFALNALISTDLLLVKRFFDPDIAGLYAGLALVGKVIFFLTAPIGTVMYPLIVQKHAMKQNYKNTLLLALAIVFLPSIFSAFIYFLIPDFVLTLFLRKSEYLEVSRYLGLFGVFISFYSLISLFTYYFISIKKTIIWIPLSVASLAQFIIIYFYHSNFSQVINASLGVSVLLLFILLIYFKKTT